MSFDDQKSVAVKSMGNSVLWPLGGSGDRREKRRQRRICLGLLFSSKKIPQRPVKRRRRRRKKREIFMKNLRGTPLCKGEAGGNILHHEIAAETADQRPAASHH